MAWILGSRSLYKAYFGCEEGLGEIFWMPDPSLWIQDVLGSIGAMEM